MCVRCSCMVPAPPAAGRASKTGCVADLVTELEATDSHGSGSVCCRTKLNVIHQRQHVSTSGSPRAPPYVATGLQPLRTFAIRNLQHSTKPNSSKAPSQKPALCFRKPACQKSHYWPWLPRDVRLQTLPSYQRPHSSTTAPYSKVHVPSSTYERLCSSLRRRDRPPAPAYLRHSQPTTLGQTKQQQSTLPKTRSLLPEARVSKKSLLALAPAGRTAADATALALFGGRLPFGCLASVAASRPASSSDVVLPWGFMDSLFP